MTSSKRYSKGRGFLSAPVNASTLRKVRAPTGMPKLAKNPNYQPQKPAKKPAKRAKKRLPPMRSHTSLSIQAKTQARDQSSKFVPIEQRGFFGRLKALMTGELQEHTRKNQAAHKRRHAAWRRQQK